MQASLNVCYISCPDIGMKVLMRFGTLILLYWLISFTASAQNGTISGKVMRLDNKAPVEKATVFLNNATYGTATAQDGTFTLTGVKPGQYDLVVTSVGYEEYSRQIMVGKETLKLDIALTPKTTELRDVVITTPEGWKRNYEMFLKYFMGTSEDARKCKILNPRDLYFNYHKSKKTLEASSDTFIVIQNYALGYNVKVLLKSFENDGLNDITRWQARVLFEDMPGNASQKRKWQQRRDDVYYGSTAHFLRALMADQLRGNGFEIRQLVRKPNKLRPPQELIDKKLAKFRTTNRDSALYWIGMSNMSKYDETLIRRPMLAQEIVRKAPQDGIYALFFPDYLYVMYNKRYETADFRDVYRPLDLPNYEASVVTLYNPYALFDANGTVVTSQSTMYEGSWTKNKGAELLPVDYTPVNEPPVLPLR